MLSWISGKASIDQSHRTGFDLDQIDKLGRCVMLD
jgi:hypothetical protein